MVSGDSSFSSDGWGRATSGPGQAPRYGVMILVVLLLVSLSPQDSNTVSMKFVPNSQEVFAKTLRPQTSHVTSFFAPT